MARILFAWEMGEGMGHLVPLKPVLEAMVAQGHELVVAAVDLRSARAALGHIALSFVQAPKVIDRRYPLPRPAEGVADLLALNGFCDPPMRRGRHHVWLQIATLFKPDLVLAEHSPGALLMARALGLPAIHAGTGFTLPPEQQPMLFPSFEAGDNPAREAAIIADFNALIAETGGRPLDSLQALYNDVADRFLLTFRELDQLGPREGVEYLGAEVPDSGLAPSWPAGTKRAFAYLKPRPDLEAFFQAIKRLGVALLMVPDRVNPELIKKYNGGSISVVQERFNMRQVIEQADMLVFNGNHGTACAGLVGGVPMVAFPLHQEQETCTRRIATSNLGAGLLKSDPERMLSVLQRGLRDSAIRASCDRARQRHRKFDYRDSVAAMVESMGTLL